MPPLRALTIGTQFSQTLVCNPALGVKSLAEWVARAKAGPLSDASGGAGVPGDVAELSLVMYAPKGVPEAIVSRFRQAFVDALNAPDVLAKLKAGDQAVVASTPAQAATALAADSKKWGEVARRIKLGLD